MSTVKDLGIIRKAWSDEDELCCMKMATAYVNGYGVIDVRVESFMGKPGEEMKKHRDLVKKMISMDLGNKMVEDGFEIQPLAIMEDALDYTLQDGSAEMLLRKVAAGLPNGEEFMIMMYHCIYDIEPGDLEGTEAQEDSEYVYKYIICAICPIKPQKHELAAVDGSAKLSNVNKLIKAPEAGFIWPAWCEGRPDYDRILIYNNDPSKPMHEVFEGLEASAFRTTEELREIFKKMVEEEYPNREDRIKLAKAISDYGIGRSLSIKISLRDAGLTASDKFLEDYERTIEPYKPKAEQLVIPEHARDYALKSKRERKKRILEQAAEALKKLGGDKKLIDDLIGEANV